MLGKHTASLCGVQSFAGQGYARLGEAGRGSARRGVAWPIKARHGLARPGRERQGAANILRFPTSRGSAAVCQEWLGEAWGGKAGQGAAWQGTIFKQPTKGVIKQ